jgi:hypothetical protein
MLHRLVAAAGLATALFLNSTIVMAQSALTLAQCTTSPATPGCAAVLPSVLVCTSTPATPGCQAVLPSLATCTSTPALAGCSAVLPTLADCKAKPALTGCSAVLPPARNVAAGTATAAPPQNPAGPLVAPHPLAPPGLYVSVTEPILVQNPGGGSGFQAGQFGYTPSLQHQPVIVPPASGLKFAPPPPVMLVPPTTTQAAPPPTVASCSATYLLLASCVGVAPAAARCATTGGPAGCQAVLARVKCSATPSTAMSCFTAEMAKPYALKP